MSKTLAEKAAHMREYRQRRKAAGRPLANKTPEQVWSHSLKKRYGITPADWNQMFREQGGVCAICRKEFAETNQAGNHKDNAVVDHCHKTGKVRGLLCPHCNLGLGHFMDSPKILQAALLYLP
jgi:hypothetical protein